MARNHTLLIVEDDPSLRELLQITFSTHYLVESAGDGQTAMDLFAKFHPHAVLLDIMIPVLDANEICLRIRASGVEPQPKIIILTGAADSEAIRKRWEVEHKINGFFIKPYDLSDLKAHIEKLLGS